MTSRIDRAAIRAATVPAVPHETVANRSVSAAFCHRQGGPACQPRPR